MKDGDFIFMKIVLASKSPRRKELLGEIYEDFEIMSAEVDESLDSSVHPREGVEILAVKKGAAAVALAGEDALVISSDTLVELDGVPLGKPENPDDAAAILRRLSGKTHSVHTGVAVHFGGRVFSGVDSTRVSFRELSEAEISEYVKSGEPMDKAGAYGIQGGGGKFVSATDGDFDTVVGLSLRLTRELIKAALGND